MDVYTFLLVLVGLVGMMILLYKCMDNRAKERAVAASHKTDVDTVGKDSEGHVELASATGLRSDNVGDALKTMKQIGNMKTTGMTRGSANTVEATGVDIRRRQQRPGEENANLRNIMESCFRVWRLLCMVFRRFFGGTDEKRKGD
ncbi:uncharacterized protein LOC124124749 isoform X2 [Haliotis rufescens]|nr:uncharacterized protein LOC124124749 isoform X2 [Haliotis rufescens]